MNRNVVLLVLDTVRKDVFDERASGIRERSTLSFERAYAPSSWTVPSHASMFTGRLPHQHGVHAHNPDYRALSREDTFLSDLPHRHVGASANSFLSERFSFDAWFDDFAHLHGMEDLLPGGIDTAEFIQEYDGPAISRHLAYLGEALRESSLTPSLANAMYLKMNNATLGRPVPRLGDYGARATLRAGRRLATREEPFFLFINLVDAHAPHERLRSYDTSVSLSWTSRKHSVWEVNNRGLEQFPQYLDRFSELYGCAVEYLDRRVCHFLDRLREATAEDTTVIVTADHGEELGRESERTLGHKIPSAAITHVPLEVINPPKALEMGTLQEVVSLLDIDVLVSGIVNGERISLERKIAPTERLGDVHPPEQRREFWNRGIRVAYTDCDSYEWDTTGARHRYRVERSTEHRIDDEAKIPSSVSDEYVTDLETARREATSGGGRLADAVDDRTRDRLEDLGYM
ncbi:sulfatase-like hydrolase/transferase [Halorhabdus amylolytica]|uniref:sulfatase-like hydrolase/transferase n=1 Tax=Halorhabdus amylolytica TaxID=2559573 RepID=UPI0010A9C33C|nr:sulfatase-like hydrolase/transferase [Halorhabdus amylolytica]